MSRENKVNPGIYTQRGRLTQDDSARELREQSAIGATEEAPSNGQAKATKAKTPTTAVKRTTAATRRGVLARNVGGGGAPARPTTKRRTR